MLMTTVYAPRMPSCPRRRSSRTSLRPMAATACWSSRPTPERPCGSLACSPPGPPARRTRSDRLQSFAAVTDGPPAEIAQLGWSSGSGRDTNIARRSERGTGAGSGTWRRRRAHERAIDRKKWRSLPDSNRCYSLERAMSWASRRRERRCRRQSVCRGWRERRGIICALYPPTSPSLVRKSSL